MLNAKPSRVYIMMGPNGTIKVGRSIHPLKRARQLRGFAGGAVHLLYATPVLPDSCWVEVETHKKIKSFNVSDEWYSITFEQAFNAMREAIAEVKEKYRLISSKPAKSYDHRRNIYRYERWKPKK